MVSWYQEPDRDRKNIIFSKVRLARNWNEYVFPSRLSDAEAKEMVGRLCEGLKDIGNQIGQECSLLDLSQAGELELKMLKERRVINSAILKKKAPMSMYLSEKEDVSVVFNGSDHIRIQVLKSGLHEGEAWQKASQLDDFINARFPYAFDEKYGYLTAFPTNVGTGMHAAVVVHLPSLSMGKKFPSMIADMGRFGVAVRGLYGEGRENYGAFYEISNQKTMGLTEQDIVDLVTRVALQLDEQETQVRNMTLKNHRLIREDEIYKSYGLLRYARRIGMKEAMSYLSQLMTGTADELIGFAEPCSVFQLILGIQNANLQNLSKKPLDKGELDAARAEYLRERLPELV